MRAFPLVVATALICCLASTSAWAQELGCDPCSYDFGSVQVGKTSSYSIQLANNNTQPLVIFSKSVQGDAFSFGSFPLPMRISPYSSIELPIVFAPTASGSTQGVLELISNAFNSPIDIDVYGTGAGNSNPQLAVSPATLSFGNVTVGSSASLQATLTASNAAVTVSSDQLSNSEFAIVGLTLPVTIAAGKRISDTIQFTPTATGAATGQATFTSNATNSPTVDQLSGTGVAAAKPQLSISTATLNFGNVTVGSSASLQATLTASNAAVTISSDKSTNTQYAVVGLTLPVTIAAGKSLSVTIQFTPTAATAASAKTKFVSNAQNSPAVEQSSGTGVAAVNPQLGISPATLSFGNVTVGSSTSLPATLTASGAAVTISSDQSSSSEFVILGLTLPITIAAGNSVPVTIQFTPNASGTATAKTGFISNAVNSPTVDQVTGTGVAAVSHSVTLTWQPGDGNAVGYNVYRGAAAAGPFQEINTALDSSTNYTDTTVDSGTTYYYVTTEVNAEGQESTYSSAVQAVVPSP